MDRSEQKNREELTVYWTQAQPIVSAFISSVVQSFQDAEDVLQMTAITLAKKYDQYDQSRPFVAWAIGIAKYEVLTYRRQKAKDQHVFDDAVVDQITQAYQETASELNGLGDALRKCLKEVKGRSRKMLELRYIRELKPTRIGRQLGMTTNAVFVALHRIRIALRECIERRLAATEESR